MQLRDYPGDFAVAVRSEYWFPEVRYTLRTGATVSSRIIIQGCFGTAAQAIAGEQAAESVYGSKSATVAEKMAASIIPHDMVAAMYETNPPEPFYCRIFTIITNKHPSVKPPTLVTEGKNLGRLNRTSVFHQALIAAYSDYKKLVLNPNRQFAHDSPHLRDRKNNSATKELAAMRERVPPMLVCADDPERWFSEHRHVMIQPKLDGTRLMARHIGGRLVAYSRKGKDVAPNNFFGELEQLTALYPEVYFDGEIYAHGLSLQQIAGTSKNLGKGNQEQSIVNFEIYDLYDPARPEWPYAERYNRYCQIAGEVAARQFKHVRFLRGRKPTAWLEVKSAFDEAIALGYEGLVLKDLAAPYDPSFNDYHSSWCCKYKKAYTAEFKCVGWARGEGKQLNMVSTWTMRIVAASSVGRPELDARLQGARGHTFRCNLKATDEARRAWFEEFSAKPKAFDTHYMGLMATIEFFDLSDGGIPIQPYWIAFRDYEGSDDESGIVEPEFEPLA